MTALVAIKPLENVTLYERQSGTGIYLALPFPPSTNDLLQIGRGRGHGKPVVFRSTSKNAFLKEADAMFLQQKRQLAGLRISGPFTYHLTLSEKLRTASMDGDNREKAALDFLQRVNLIDNDKYAQGGSWAWGPCEHEALIGVWPFRVGTMTA